MLRGTSKQVVVIRDTGSDLFEEALFIIDPAKNVEGIAERELAAEARRIVTDYMKRTGLGGGRRRKRAWQLALRIGVCLAAVGGAATALILLL